MHGLKSVLQHDRQVNIMTRPYYEAYDDRYRQVHAQTLEWFSRTPSPIVAETLHKYGLTPEHKLLELGCGEGRDAYPLLDAGYDLLATDVSAEAIGFCRRQAPRHADHFQVLDCVGGTLEGRFDFIYAVAVVHMLVEDAHRQGFYAFIREHLTPGGIALICTMGDGTTERSSDIRTAFDLQERTHEESGQTLRIAGTSCRMVSFQTFETELAHAGLAVLEQGITAVEPDFPQMMYAVVRGEYSRKQSTMPWFHIDK